MKTKRKNYGRNRLRLLKTHTKKIQSKRGVLSGKSRRIGSLEDTRPWDDLGISRRKYFYMKKNGEGK